MLGQIEMALELKFGSAGLALMPAIEAIKVQKVLQRLRTLAKTAATLDEVRQALPS